MVTFDLAASTAGTVLARPHPVNLDIYVSSAKIDERLTVGYYSWTGVTHTDWTK